MAPLTLLAGLCLRQAVHEVCGVDAKVKWPNDLLVASGDGRYKKLAGILTEMSGQVERTDWMVVGIGLNVHNSFSEKLSARAASLHGLTGQVWPRAQILNTFLSIFFADYARFLKEGFEPFQRRYWAHYFAPDHPVCLHTASGEISGNARGVDANGGIMIESRRKIRAFTEGEIVLPWESCFAQIGFHGH